MLMIYPIKMSFYLIILTSTFFASWINVRANEIWDLKKTVIIDSDAEFKYDLRNNTLLYTECRIGESLNCTITLKTFSLNQKSRIMKCPLYSEIHFFNAFRYRFEYLYDDRIIFMYMSFPIWEHTNTIVLNIFIINMANCNYVLSKIESIMKGPKPNVITDVMGFPLISYVDTFDLFFIDAKLCGNMLCGQTYDKNGNIINGPVASYLPNHWLIAYSIDPKSSSMGYFVQNRDEYYLISPNHGDIVKLLDRSSSDETISFSNKFFGIVHRFPIEGKVRWGVIYDNKIKCTQFDAHGIKTLDTNFDSKYGEYLGMYNLNNGSVLLLRAECDEEYPKCDVIYNLKKVSVNNSVENIYSFVNFRCSSREYKSYIEEENGNICITLACRDVCYVRNNKKTCINFKYTCFSYN